MKRFTLFSAVIVFITMGLLSACGFHPANINNVPKQLRTIQFSSNDENSQFSKFIVENLRLHSIKIRNNAPYTLSFSQSPLQTTQTTTGTSQIARQYSAIITAYFKIKNSKTGEVISSTTLSSTRTITLFSGQLLENSSQKDDVTKAIQRDIVEQLFFYLESKDLTLAVKQASQAPVKSNNLPKKRQAKDIIHHEDQSSAATNPTQN